MKQIKAVCQRWRGLIACHPLIFVSYGRELKKKLHVYIPLYKLLLKSVSVFANGSDENAEEGRTVAWCLHSVCHGIISDWLWKYGDLWTNLSLSLSLYATVYLFATRTVTNNPLANWSKPYLMLTAYFCIRIAEPYSVKIRLIMCNK